MKEIKKRFEKGVPYLDPKIDMGIKEESFERLVQKIKLLEEKLFSSKFEEKKKEIEEKYENYSLSVERKRKIKEIKKKIDKKEKVVLSEDLKNMYRVLRRLNFINKNNVIETKGRVACEIFATHSLLLTEMIFNGIFNQLSVEQCVALLSCFVIGEKTTETVKLKQTLAKPLRQLQELARRIATVSKECKIEIDVNDYVEQFEPSMMDVVYQWVNGSQFSEICKMTSIFEGTIIRCMRRLEELLRQLSQASKAIGNTELEQKFAQGILKIKRDIVFASSLYI